MTLARNQFARACALCGLLLVAGLLLVGPAGCGGAGHESLPTFYPGNTAVPTTGPDVPGVQSFDAAMSALLKKWNIPGAAVAVVHNGRLVLARGYGYADFEAKQLMQPDSMSRIGSASKVLTAMAVLHLKEQGRLDLDARFLDVLPQYHAQPGGDPRLRTITIRQLLQHSGGWDRDLKGDPLAKQREIAHALRLQTPVSCPDVIRFEMGEPLDFAPGTKFDYSNFGYCILGAIVEKVSGQPLEPYVREHVLAPMDVHAMSVGYSHLSQRGPKEVKYYDYDGAPLFPSVFPGEGRVPEVYGSFEMATSPASGGWIGSAIDLTRVMTAIDGSRKPSFLAPDSLRQWLEDPRLPAWSPDGTWYGLGVFVHASPELWYHGGSIPGGETQLLHDGNGYVFAVVTNSRSRDIYKFPGELWAAMFQALGNGVVGSAEDLYEQYPSPDLPARTK